MYLLFDQNDEALLKLLMVIGVPAMIYIFYRIWKSGATFKGPGQSWDSSRSTNRLVNQGAAYNLSKEDPELVKKAIENLRNGGYPINPLSIENEVGQIKTMKKLKTRRIKYWVYFLTTY